MNKNLFKAKMSEFGETQRDIAQLLGITEASLSAKINEKGTCFTQKEIVAIRDHYLLSPGQLTDIFFALNVS